MVRIIFGQLIYKNIGRYVRLFLNFFCCKIIFLFLKFHFCLHLLSIVSKYFHVPEG